MASIYQQIYDTCLDREFETILINLIKYNNSKYVEIQTHQFLDEYVLLRNEF